MHPSPKLNSIYIKYKNTNDKVQITSTNNPCKVNDKEYTENTVIDNKNTFNSTIYSQLELIKNNNNINNNNDQFNKTINKNIINNNIPCYILNNDSENNLSKLEIFKKDIAAIYKYFYNKYKLISILAIVIMLLGSYNIYSIFIDALAHIGLEKLPSFCCFMICTYIIIVK